MCACVSEGELRWVTLKVSAVQRIRVTSGGSARGLVSSALCQLGGGGWCGGRWGTPTQCCCLATARKDVPSWTSAVSEAACHLQVAKIALSLSHCSLSLSLPLCTSKAAWQLGRHLRLSPSAFSDLPLPAPLLSAFCSYLFYFANVSLTTFSMANGFV